MVTRLQTNKRWSRQRHGQILKTQSSSPQITKDQQSPISTIATFTNLVRNPSEYSDCSAGNGNNANLRFSVTNHSINSYDTIRSTRFISLQNSNTYKFKRLKLAIVIIVVLVLAGISAAVTVLVLRNKPGDTYITPVQMMVRVDDNYTDEMNNTSSEVFQRFNDSFCSNLTNTLLLISKGVSCQVNSLRNGSIIVNSTVYIITDVQPTEDSIMGILQSAPPWKNTLNINMSIGQSEPLGHAFPARIDTFDCLNERDGTLLPLKNTYPDNCNSFQICENGVGTNVSCDGNFHFAIMESSVCILDNSPSTYCNRRSIHVSLVTGTTDTTTPLSSSSASTSSAEKSDTTTSLSSSSAGISSTETTTPVSSSSASTSSTETTDTTTPLSSSSTSTSSTENADTTPLSSSSASTSSTEKADTTPRSSSSVSTSSTETAADTTTPFSSSSSSIGTTLKETPSHITAVSSLSTTYSTTPPTEVNCTGLNGDYFPRNDTYPNKCDQFIRCVYGLPVLLKCSACTYFTEEAHVCDWYYAPNTYCASRDSENNYNNFLPKCINTTPLSSSSASTSSTGINSCNMSYLLMFFLLVLK